MRNIFTNKKEDRFENIFNDDRPAIQVLRYALINGYSEREIIDLLSDPALDLSQDPFRTEKPLLYLACTQAPKGSTALCYSETIQNMMVQRGADPFQKVDLREGIGYSYPILEAFARGCYAKEMYLSQIGKQGVSINYNFLKAWFLRACDFKVTPKLSVIKELIAMNPLLLNIYPNYNRMASEHLSRPDKMTRQDKGLTDMPLPYLSGISSDSNKVYEFGDIACEYYGHSLKDALASDVWTVVADGSSGDFERTLKVLVEAESDFTTNYKWKFFESVLRNSLHQNESVNFIKADKLLDMGLSFIEPEVDYTPYHHSGSSECDYSFKHYKTAKNGTILHALAETNVVTSEDELPDAIKESQIVTLYKKILNQADFASSLVVNYQNGFGETALICATKVPFSPHKQPRRIPNISLIEEMLKHPNIDVNITDRRGFTAGQYLVDAIKMYHQEGFSQKERETTQRTSLYVLSRLLERIIEKADLDMHPNGRKSFREELVDVVNLFWKERKYHEGGNIASALKKRGIQVETLKRDNKDVIILLNAGRDCRN